MAASQVLRLAKLKGGGKLLAASRHNRRTLQSELGADSHIDVSRTPLNYSLAGADTPEAVNLGAKALMQAAGIEKTRKDCVLAVEIIFSLPANHQGNLREFFEGCMAWVRAEIKGHLLSFDVHLDEASPHAHALILPLVEGRMVGSDLMGNRQRLKALQASFYYAVGIHHGLRKPGAKLSGSAKLGAVQKVLGELKNDPAMQSKLWPLIRDMVGRDPAPFAEVLGLAIDRMKNRAGKSFVEIMISKGKGSNPIGFNHPQNIKPYPV